MTSDRSTIAILVVEDEPLPRLDLAEELRRAGYDVREASSAEEALAHLQNGQRVDVVITDIQLGGDLTGWDVAEKFRAAHSRIPVVYTSGNSTDRTRRVSGSIFFGKPFRAMDVVRACRSFGRPVER
jgi:CheY-like chemotaxis protein